MPVIDARPPPADLTPQPAGAGDDRHPPTADGRPLRVLLVTDSAEDTALLLQVLGRGGIAPVWERVETADGLRAALAGGPWDAVLSDYTLPGFGAPAALAVVRRADQDLPFVVVSGAVGEDAAVELMRASASDYVLKHDLVRLAPTVEREVREAGNRRARRAAERAATHLAAVVESSDDAIVSNSLDGVVSSWNPAAERLHGWAAAEAVGRHVSFLIPPDKADEWAGHMERLRAGGRVGYFETERLHRDGHRIDVAMTMSSVRDHDGRLVGVSKTVRDIRDRKRAEEALRASEARFRSLVENSWDAVALTDAAGVVLYATPATTRVFGHTLPEYVGRDELEFVHPDDLARAEGARADVAAHPGRTVTRAARFRHRDGSWRWVETALTNRLADPDVRSVVLNSRDVTAAWAAEAASGAIADRYRTLVEATAEIVWDSPPSGAFDTAQPGWTAFTGQAVEQHRGWGWLDAVHPDDRETSARGWAAAVAGRAVYRADHRLRRADGEYRHMSVRAVPVLDAGGAVREWVGVHTDVTDQRRAEADRADLLTRLTLQIERMPLAYLLSGPDFRFTGWNPAAERTFGFTRTEVLGRHPFEVVVPPQSRPAVADIFARLAAGDMDAHGSCENVTKDGRTITCEWYNTPLFDPDGTFQGLLSLAQDVTARRQAEQALRLRDRAIRAATQGLLITDAGLPDHPITYVSPGFERITGYRSDEVLGRNCRLLQGEDTDPAAAALLREAVRAGEACTVELLNYRKDGTPFWNELSVSPVREDGGRLTHFVGVQTDVTARRSLEGQFRHVQKMEAVGQLAGGIAHDFNNLLTIINGNSDLLLQDLAPGDPSREMLAEIHEAGERSAGLTRQLLAFSRQQVLAPRVLDLNAVVEDAGRMLRRLIGEDVRLTTTLAPGLWQAKADPGQVELVLMNLAVNARDAMPTGGRLTIETRNVELDEGYARTHPDARPGPHVLVAVSDTGAGMSPDVQRRVFEPFFTTKGTGQGTGLGLATVYGIVRQSGGHVGVYSEVGAGTSFKVYLPRAEPTAAAAEDRPGPRPPPRGTETVLLVEDEAGVRALARRVLAGCGYTVLEAADGAEAARVAAGHAGPIHLLVTDVVMPGVSGRVVAERLAKSHPGVRVLFVSGYTDDAVIRHGILGDGMNFLQKPFTPATLAAKAREVLDRP